MLVFCGSYSGPSGVGYDNNIADSPAFDRLFLVELSPDQSDGIEGAPIEAADFIRHSLLLTDQSPSVGKSLSFQVS